MKGETWRTVPSLDHAYAVSNFGNVRNVKTSRLLTACEKHKGGRVFVGAGGVLKRYSDQDYLQVNVSSHTKQVHRLIAEVWLPPKPSEEHMVNHRDGNKHNNRRTNLEWATSKRNAQHAMRTGLRRGITSNGGGHNHLTEEQKVELLLAESRPNMVNDYAQKFGVSTQAIYKTLDRLKPRQSETAV